jgi:NAD(P)-dependent dehydrogenase (short-subunit alcohol dehydrogenase family)
MTKTWLITGAGRGMGVEFARAALAAGHNVVATGRNADTVRSAVGEHENLLVTTLDVTNPHSAEDAVAAAVERFGGIDVLLTTPAASWPASSRRSRPSRCARRSRPTSSAR